MSYSNYFWNVKTLIVVDYGRGFKNTDKVMHEKGKTDGIQLGGKSRIFILMSL